MSLIKLEGIEKSYGKGDSQVIALSNIHLCIHEGDYIALRGKSGCGKSTLLGILGGIIKPTGGDYFFRGRKISACGINQLSKFRNTQVGMVVQHYALIKNVNVYDNIALPLYYRKMSGREVKNRVEEIMERFEISDKREKYPQELSGGQCQRVGIARAVVGKPKVLLADEPTGALDEKTGYGIMELFHELNQEGMTILIATHDKEWAGMSRKEILMADGKVL